MQTLQAYFHWTLSSHTLFLAATRLLRNHKQQQSTSKAIPMYVTKVYEGTEL